MIPTFFSSDVSDNLISEIQLNDFDGLTDTENLILSGNELRTIPAEAVAGLMDLKTL